MVIVDIAAARDAFGELLLQIFLLPLVVILVVGSVVAVAKLAGASLKELWRRSRSQLVALSVFAVGVTIVADKPGDRGGAADPPRSAVLPDACDVGEGFAGPTGSDLIATVDYHSRFCLSWRRGHFDSPPAL